MTRGASSQPSAPPARPQAAPGAGEDGLAVIAFGESARPTVLGEGLLRDLLERVERAGAEPAVRAVVLLGRGRVFALGADLESMRGMGAAALEEYLALGQRLMAAVENLPVPTIAAVNGLAFGGGMELALACDVRWMHVRAAFELPECRKGLVPAWGATRLLRSRLPSSLAFELLCGGRMTAEEARAIGLAGRLFDGAEDRKSVV